MPTAQLKVARYDDDEAYYVSNSADAEGDRLDDHPAILELQQASKHAIFCAIQNNGSPVVKISVSLAPRHQVGGYMTLLRFIEGASLSELERKLGFRDGALAAGCRIHRIDPTAVKVDDIGPRYMTSWSAGVSPRDLYNLSQRSGKKVCYHRDYPAASDPIPQFVIFRPAPVIGSVVITGTGRVASF